MEKPNIEKNIFLCLTKTASATLDEIALKIKCKKEDVKKVIQNNTKNTSNPLGFILEDNKTTPCHYSIEPTNYDTIHTQINNYLKGTDGILKLYFKNLSKKNSIFKIDKSQNSSLTAANLNQNGIIMLEKIGLILDRIQQLSFLINYYKLTNMIPAHMAMYVDDDHSKCLQAYLEVIKKLKNVADSKETHQNAIELCLFKHQFVVNHINF
mgnify:FL=1|jgi:hypothetical protein